MIEFTGERLVPGEVDPDLLNEHLARYAFAARLARGQRVLDIACGVGYGSAMLARVAESVVGVDVAAEAVATASATYTLPNLRFEAAPAQHLPFEDGSFDLVVAYEVIEHLEDWPELLAEAKRVLSPRGQFVVSTPNIEFYAESRRLDGPNPYHKHEFTHDEFHTALARYFPSVTMFLQNHVASIAIQPLQPPSAVAAELAAAQTPPDPQASHFYLAVCALGAQLGAPLYLYVPATANLLRERERHIVKLEEELQQKDRWLSELQHDHAALQTAHEKLIADSDEKAAWTLRVQQQLDETRARIVVVQNELETHNRDYEAKIMALENDLQARAAHIQRLDTEIASRVNRLQAVESSRWVRFGRKIGLGPHLEE